MADPSGLNAEAGGLLDALVAGLEPAEVSALQRYGEGWSREEIAAHLGVGPRSVHDSLARARRKLGAHSHSHAAWMLRVRDSALRAVGVGAAEGGGPGEA